MSLEGEAMPTPPGVVVDRRMRPWSGPRDRRSMTDRRKEQIPVAVDRRASGDRRMSDRSRSDLWQHRGTVA